VRSGEEEFVDKLIAIYREEDSLYRQLADLTRRLAALADDEQAEAESILELLESRGRCLEKIEHLESLVKTEKNGWDEGKLKKLKESRELQAVLGNIQNSIESCLKLDGEVESRLRARMESTRSALGELTRGLKAQRAYLRKPGDASGGRTRARV